MQCLFSAGAITELACVTDVDYNDNALHEATVCNLSITVDHTSVGLKWKDLTINRHF